jgi:hypothetical protein
MTMNALIRRVAGVRRIVVGLAAGLTLGVILAPPASACHTKSYPLGALLRASWGWNSYMPPLRSLPVTPQIPTMPVLSQPNITTPPLVVTPTVPVTPTTPVTPALPQLVTPDAPPISPVPEPSTGLIALGLFTAAVWARQRRRRL